MFHNLGTTRAEARNSKRPTEGQRTVDCTPRTVVEGLRRARRHDGRFFHERSKDNILFSAKPLITLMDNTSRRSRQIDEAATKANKKEEIVARLTEYREAVMVSRSDGGSRGRYEKRRLKERQPRYLSSGSSERVKKVKERTGMVLHRSFRTVVGATLLT